MKLGSSLGCFPPEILNDILCLSGGRSIIFLYECGDAQLNFNMARRGGAKTFEFTFRVTEDVCIPPLIYRLSALEHLSLGTTHCLQKREHLEGWKPEKLPVSLRSINVSLFTHNRYLHDCVGGPPNLKPLSTLFPNLNSLLGQGDELEVNSRDFALLPNLTRLNLGIALKACDIRLLPRFLVDLSFALSKKCPPEFDPSFPPSLNRLVLKSLTRAYFLRYLPDQIESLELVGTGDHSHCMQEEWGPDTIARLPSTIKHLRIAGLPISLDVPSFRLIGRQIESLSIVGGTLTGSSTDILNAIPPKIKILDDVHIVPAGGELSLDPIREAAQHSLSQLRTSTACFMSLWELINWYPPHLTTSKEENSILTEQNPPLPNSITKLNFARPSFQDRTLRPMTMPAALTSIKCYALLHPDAISSLSFCRHLTSASLVLSAYDIPKLPKTLKKLKWKFDAYELRPFPQDLSFEGWNLETLVMEADCELYPDMLFFSTLPPTLGHLSIECGPYSAMSAQILRLWFNLRNLHTLELSSIEGCKDEDLESLPPNLLSMKISQFTKYRLTQDCFLKLPSKLVSLGLPSLMKFTSIPVKIGHLKHLNVQSRDQLAHYNVP